MAEIATVEPNALVTLIVLMTAFTNLLTAAIVLFAALAFRSSVKS
jgi:hypothetical protein